MSSSGSGEPSGQAKREPTPPPGIQLAFENAKEKLEQQRAGIDQLDAKIATVIALLGIVLVAYAAGARTGLERILGGLLLLGSLGGALYAYMIRDYADAPNPESFARYAGYRPDEMRAIFLNSVLEAYKQNDRRLRWKARSINAAFVALTLLGSLVLVILIFALDTRV